MEFADDPAQQSEAAYSPGASTPIQPDPSSSNTTTGLLTLPDDVLSGSILSRLHVPQHVAHTRLVCRRLAALARGAVRFLNVHPNTLQRTESLCSALPSMPNLEILSSEARQNDDDDDDPDDEPSHDVNDLVVALSQHCPKLVSLNLCVPKIKPLRATSLGLLLNHCCFLQELVIGEPWRIHSWLEEGRQNSLNPSEEGSSPDHPQLPRMLALDVSSLSMIPVMRGAEKQRVKRLKLRRDKRLELDEGVLSLAAGCSNAEYLHLTNFPFSSCSDAWGAAALMERLGALGELRSLRVLCLIAGWSVSDGAFQSPLPPNFRNLQQLEDLMLAQMLCLSDIDSVCYLPKLTSLVVSSCGRIPLPDQMSNLTALRVLRYVDCTPSSFARLGLLRNLGQLRLLYLQGLEMRVLPHSLSQLERLGILDVSHCARLECLPDWLLHMHRLYLCITGCTGLSSQDSVMLTLRSNSVEGDGKGEENLIYMP